MNHAPYLDSRYALRVIHHAPSQLSDMLMWTILVGGCLLLGFIFKSVGPAIDPDVAAPHLLGWPLESTFTISTVLAGVLCFRTWARMYPTDIPAAYTLYPLRSSAVFIRQLQETCMDGVAFALCLTAWNLPSWLLSQSPHADYALFYAWTASFVATGIAFGAPPLVIRLSLGAHLKDTQGVPAEVSLHGAPAVAFGLTVTALLFLKLGTEELALALQKANWMTAAWTHLRMGEGLSWVTPSTVLAVGIPLLSALALLLVGAIIRLRYWLHDSIRVAAAAAYQPDLSYAWIEAHIDAKREPNATLTLTRRDVTRLRRAQPFRIWAACAFSIVTALMVYLAAPSTRWIALILLNVWVVAWLRLPQKVMRAWPPSLWEWDALMVEKSAIRRARWATMIQVLLPYLVCLALPGIVYALCYRPWWPACISIVAIGIILTQAYTRLHQATS